MPVREPPEAGKPKVVAGLVSGPVAVAPSSTSWEPAGGDST